jgi:hypothetical protein
MGVRRPDWWCYPERCGNRHEWGPGLITVSWVLRDCPPGLLRRGRAAPRATWRCSATLCPAAGLCGTGPVPAVLAGPREPGGAAPGALLGVR